MHYNSLHTRIPSGVCDFIHSSRIYLSARAAASVCTLRSTREHIISIKAVRVKLLINKPLLSAKYACVCAGKTISGFEMAD